MKKTTKKTNRKTADVVELKLAVKPVKVSEDADTMVQNSVVLDLRVHTPSFRKQVKTKDIIDESEADAELLHVSKDLIDPAALEDLRVKKGRLMRWLRNQAVPVPNNLLRPGMFMIPLDATTRVDNRVIEFIAERERDVDAKLVDPYTELVKDAKKRLKEHFNPDDYPKAAELKKAFGVDADWRGSLNIPAALERADREIFERQKLRITKQLDDAAADIPQNLKTLYQALIDNAVDRLGADPETGKLNVFRDSFVEKINEFLATFESRLSVCSPATVGELKVLGDRLREVMKGVTPDVLRENMGQRTFVQKECEKIGAALDKAVIGRRRKITLRRAEAA